MSRYVPDGVKIYEADIDNWMLLTQHVGFAGLGIQVIAQTVPNMTVRTTGGPYRLRHGGGLGVDAGLVTVNATDPLVIAAADPTNPRIDLVHVDYLTGVTAVVTGTPAAVPKPPVLPATSVLLGYVSVPAAAVNIQNANITQRSLAMNDNVIAGTLAERPSAVAHSGTFYVVTDGVDGTTLYRADGASSTWVQIALGSAPATLTTENKILNSDFARRTVFGLAMPEVFADTNGYADTGAATVASNILTQSAGGEVLRWPKSAAGTFWRDGRASATFKAVNVAGNYRLIWHYVDNNNFMTVGIFNGNFKIQKVIAGVTTDVTVSAFALTLNRWYWLEIESQGTTVIGRVYDTGVTTPGTLKAGLAAGISLTVTISEAAVQLGDVGVTSDINATQWGGIATGNGGVYVETWLPESWGISFTGTLGGQSLGYEESAGGPLGTTWALVGYIPHASRSIVAQQTGGSTTVADLAPLTTYAGSQYVKVSGKGGSGSLIETVMYSSDLVLGNLFLIADLHDNGSTSWTRKTYAAQTIDSFGRRHVVNINWNAAFTATGTGYVQNFQLEQSSFVTAWRNAPADSAPIAWEVVYTGADLTTTSASFVEVSSRDLAGNFLFPWDCRLRAELIGTWMNSGANRNDATLDLDGASTLPTQKVTTVANSRTTLHASTLAPVTAGKHRIRGLWRTTGGTATITTLTDSDVAVLRVVAIRGK